MARRELSAGLVHTPLLQGLPNLIMDPWRKFLAQATENSNLAPAIATVTIASRTSAILTTPIASEPLSGGLYRVSLFTRIVTPASVNSSATPSITFTDSANVCTFTGTANTGNTVTSVSTNTFLVRVQAGTPISYAVAYASNAAGMAFDLEIVVEQIG